MFNLGVIKITSYKDKCADDSLTVRFTFYVCLAFSDTSHTYDELGEIGYSLSLRRPFFLRRYDYLTFIMGKVALKPVNIKLCQDDSTPKPSYDKNIEDQKNDFSL